MLDGAHCAGFPTLPPIKRPARLNPGAIRKDVAADAIHRALRHCDRTGAMRAILRLVNLMPLEQVIEASFLAIRFDIAQRIDRILQVLSSPRFISLAEQIEKQACILSVNMLVGYQNSNSLSWGGAISDDVHELLKNDRELIRFLKIVELNDGELLERLGKNEAAKRDFIDQRSQYAPGTKIIRTQQTFLRDLHSLDRLVRDALLDGVLWPTQLRDQLSAIRNILPPVLPATATICR